jgi:hypothetical protein
MFNRVAVEIIMYMCVLLLCQAALKRDQRPKYPILLLNSLFGSYCVAEKYVAL